RHTEERLEALDHEIATHKAYGVLSDAHQAEVADRIAALDTERLSRLRHLRRDVPQIEAIIAETEEVAAEELHHAQAGRPAALGGGTVAAVGERWGQEVLELLEPVLDLLARARGLDAGYKLAGVDLTPGDGAARGRQRLHEAVLHLVRRATH